MLQTAVHCVIGLLCAITIPNSVLGADATSNPHPTDFGFVVNHATDADLLGGQPAASLSVGYAANAGHLGGQSLPDNPCGSGYALSYTSNGFECVEGGTATAPTCAPGSVLTNNGFGLTCVNSVSSAKSAGMMNKLACEKQINTGWLNTVVPSGVTSIGYTIVGGNGGHSHFAPAPTGHVVLNFTNYGGGGGGGGGTGIALNGSLVACANGGDGDGVGFNSSGTLDVNEGDTLVVMVGGGGGNGGGFDKYSGSYAIFYGGGGGGGGGMPGCQGGKGTQGKVHKPYSNGADGNTNTATGSSALSKLYSSDPYYGAGYGGGIGGGSFSLQSGYSGGAATNMITVGVMPDGSYFDTVLSGGGGGGSLGSAGGAMGQSGFSNGYGGNGVPVPNGGGEGGSAVLYYYASTCSL